MNDGPPDAPVDVGQVDSDGDPDRNPDHDREPQTWRVTAREIGAMRRRVHLAARRAGLASDAADRFTVAANEVVINALQHGGGVAEVTIRHDAGVLVTVADRGPGLVLDRPASLPPPDQEHGRGLWLVHQLCDDVTIHRGPDGTRVGLRAGGTAP